jgi:hypothetical protein
VDLRFPALSGGQSQGLNDAGVETFAGSVDPHLARECGQNTGDARRPESRAARIEFHRTQLLPADVPAFEQLRAALTASREFWRGHEKEDAFFEAALSMAQQPTIPVLRISDHGTHGLTGGDTDRLGRWYALVKSQGLSNKGETAAGSFGIGKSSPFAASRFRTVFYGTRVTDGGVALQGVTRLVTHKDPGGKKTQGTGFIGDYDPEGDEGEPLFKAVRDPSRIPATFLRDRPGTDIWVVGYRSGPEWQDELLRSILTNFWPAVHAGHLVFQVADVEVNRDSCGRLIDRFAGHDGFLAHLFYPASVSQPVKAQLRHVGQCELYLATGNADLPKKVCMVRGSGMRIFDYSPRACRVPFSGLFRCVDDQGNKLLRQLEPPRHDAWEHGRIDGPTGRQALDAIKAWIREEVKKLNPYHTGRSFDETELSKYVPEDLDGDAPELQSGDASAAEDSLEPRRQAGTAAVRTVEQSVTPTAPGTEPADASGEGDAGTESDRGDGGSGDEDGAGTGGGDAAGTRRSVRVTSRCFATDESGTYQLILRSESPYSGSVAVVAVGEDGEREPVGVISAASADGASKLIAEGNVVRDVSIEPGTPTRLSIRIEAASLRSLIGVGVR